MEDSKLRSGLTVLALVISVIGLILSIRIMSGYEDVVGTAITLTMILMAVAAGVAVLFAVLHLVTNIKQNIPLLGALIAFVVIGIISYTLGSDSTAGYGDDITATTSRLSDAGIIFMYILIAGAVVAALIGEVTRIFK